VSVLDLKLKETVNCLERIGQISHQRDQELAKLEEELRKSNERANMLKIGARQHETENIRSIVAGFIVGAVLGAVFMNLLFI
jgi:hypothetical protein